MKEPEFNKNEEPKGKGELQAIKGIDKSIAQALEELGIKGYVELAVCDPGELQEILRGRLPTIIILQSTLRAWIQQARSLAGQEGMKAPYTTGLSREMAWIPFSHRGTNASSGWREIADFFLSFGYEEDERGEARLMTRVHHSQADRQMQWQGIVTTELLEWLGEQAKLPELSGWGRKDELKEEVLEAPENAPEAIRVTLSNLWVSEAGIPATGAKRVEAPALKVSGHLILSGQGSVGYVQDRLQFAVDVLLVNTESNQPTLAGTYNGRSSPGELSYPLEQDFRIPGKGRYQLYLMARVPPPAEVVKFVQGPIIVAED